LGGGGFLVLGGVGLNDWWGVFALGVWGLGIGGLGDWGLGVGVDG